MKLIYIGLGGFIGAILRYIVSGLVLNYFQKDFPYGTLAVNLIGCFFLGLMASVSMEKMIHTELKSFIMIGLLGAFTTFSTFSYETMTLLEQGSLGLGAANICVSIFFGLGAVWLGTAAGRLI